MYEQIPKRNLQNPESAMTRLNIRSFLRQVWKLLAFNPLNRSDWKRLVSKYPRQVARLLGPNLTSKIAFRFIEIPLPLKKGQPNVLCIDREQFGKDIDQLRLRTDNCAFEQI